MNKNIILGVVFVFLCSCSTGDKDTGGSTESHTDKGKGKYGVYADCKWYLDATCPEGELCGFGEAQKDNPSLARRAAAQRARAELSEQIGTRIQSLMRDHMEESGVYGQSMSSEYTESVIKQVSDRILEYAEIDDTCVLSDGVTTVVRVAWSKTQAKDETAAAVKKEEALYSKFLGEQAFKRLEEETQNSERWDEELKED